MLRALFGIGLTSVLFISFSPAFAQEPVIFDIVRKADALRLKSYLDTSKTSIDVVNSKGYSPLHVLIENYVEERPEWREKDAYKYQQTVKQSVQYQACLQLLLDKGASLKKLTAEGWTALQYAVMKGKWAPVSLLLQKTKGGDVKDIAGNTLLHLSLLINPDEPVEHFWDNLIKQLQAFGITPSTTNSKGQTPINFYLSQPRCNPAAAQKPSAGKLAGASTPPANQTCQSSGTYKMLAKFLCESCVLTPDFSGKRAKDHAEANNKWYTSTLSFEEQGYAAIAEKMKKYQQVSESNKQATEEFLKQWAEWEAQGSKLDLSFTRTYYYECNSFQKSRIKMDEPVEVTVTPDHISVSSLSPYYGKFTIASSGYEIIDGNEWTVYHIEKTSSNSTYKAIGFYKNGCVIKSSYGEELICY
jgi:hypothetical protein